MRKVNLLELKKRKWPVPVCPLEPEISDRKHRLRQYSGLQPKDYANSAFVKEGKVVLRSLGKKEIGKCISPGESAITSLTLGIDGRVFGATSGKRAHLFVYDPRPSIDLIEDLGIIGENCRVTKALVTSLRGYILGGTRKENGRIFCFDPSSSKEKIETVSVPIKGEGIASLVIDKKLNHLYGVSTPSGIFFVFDITSGKIEFKQQIDEANLFSEALVVGPDGCVYGAGRWGRLFKYSSEREHLEFLKIKVPHMPGREMYTKIDSLAIDPKNGYIFGGEYADGILFKFNPSNMEIICLGKPLAQPHIRCLTVGKDRCVYGVGGRTGGLAHFFRYNPKKGDLRDLGSLFATHTRYWHAYEFESILTGSKGEIYLGESDRMSHLFIYFSSELI